MAKKVLRSNSDESRDALVWIRDALRTRGIMGTLHDYTKGTLELLRDLTPTPRHSRYGDIDYDLDHGVDTTWATVTLRTRVRELLSGGQYQPSEPALFHEMLDALPVVVDGFTFIDLGPGKGRTLLMASDYPFRRIVGVEILEELHRIALRNIAGYSSDGQKCFAIESHAGDARNFEFPAEPTVLYLFNPFPKPGLRAVLAKLGESLRAAPREVYIIYHTLVYEDVFLSAEWLQRLHHTHQFAIYRAAALELKSFGSTARAKSGPVPGQ